MISFWEKRMLLLVTMTISFLSLVATASYAQVRKTLTLDTCYKLAEAHYPLVKQYGLIEKTEAYSIANASKGYLPQINIGGQATYQSDVTRIPVSLPNIDIPALSNDQYKLYGEVAQPITDLFTVKDQKALINADMAVEKQNIAVELYKLRDRINQLYFGIQLIDGRIVQNDILKKDIQSGMNKNKTAIANGVALKSSADLLRAEMLKADQQLIDLQTTRKGYEDVLSALIGDSIDEHTVLEKPLPVTLISEINRPELRLFATQKQTFEAKNKLIDAKTWPRFSLFFQGGYGKPALNMLKNEFDMYYIGGVRLTWNISGFYTQKKEKQLISLSQSTLDIQKETFLFNTNLLLKQQSNEIARLGALIQTDKDIIKLRESVKLSAQNKLEYGTATTNDYLTYVNAEDQAKQNLILHEIQLLMAQYNFKTTTGN